MVVYYVSNDPDGGPPNDGVPPGWTGPVAEETPPEPPSPGPVPAAGYPVVLQPVPVGYTPYPVHIPYLVPPPACHYQPPPPYQYYPASPAYHSPQTPPSPPPADHPSPPSPPPYAPSSPLSQPSTPRHPRLPELLHAGLTTIHLVAQATQPMPYAGNWNSSSRFQFTVHMVPQEMPVWKLIKLIRPRGDPERGEGLIELHELGNGRWTRGIKISLRDERMRMSLEEVGWGAQRGAERKPVWLCYAPRE